MGAIYRGTKDVFRNGIRSFSIIFILGVSIAMALVMLIALKTVQGKIIVELLKKLAQSKKTTIIAVTHDNALSNQAQMTFQIKDGKLI
ncbi:MAG: hypothetical protein M1338_04520 [Patescibacteria group bacterium]|nr:hypothetical protein [Patescibacteria group bacterium]